MQEKFYTSELILLSVGHTHTHTHTHTHKWNELLKQGCKDQITKATKFYMVASHICGSSVRNLLHVIIMVPRVLRWLLHFWSICVPLFYSPSSLPRNKWLCQEVENVRQRQQGRLHTNFFHPHHSSAWKHTFHYHQMAHKCRWRWTEVCVSNTTMKWNINI